MKITGIECIPVTFPFRKPFVMSGATISATYTVIVKIHTDEGITGIGETGDCNEWYLGESQTSVMHMINNVFGPRILLGENPFDIEKIVARMDYAVKYNNQAKAVVDFALHDIMGKKLGVPVYELLGGLCTDKIPHDFVIGSSTPEGLVAEAKKVLSVGYHGLKVKVGALSAQEDIANIEAVREAVGRNVRIMIDANAAWNSFQAVEILKKMEKYDIAVAEQPVPWWDIDGLAALRRETRIPIFADESASELGQVMQLIKKDVVNGFLIKIPKVGGLLKAQKWVSLAKVAGLPVTCGCLLASGIEATIQNHFLVATEWMGKMEHENLGPLFHHEIYETTNTDIKTDLATKLPRYEKGFAYAPEGPGFGVELNEKVIASLISPGKSPTKISI
jgi:L-alanine-DL-glutamate epimerase-like enolase superfamily enzyme